MHKYKTVLVDFEGTQGALDTHAAQGWRLFSLAADTWRKTSGSGKGMAPPPFADLETEPIQEYTASYYLLVFVRDEMTEETGRLAAMHEPFPLSQTLEYEN